jgi:kumamolisin
MRNLTVVLISTVQQEPHTGSWKAWLDGYGSAHTDTLFQQVSIPQTALSATLLFWRHIDTIETTVTKANDTMKVQVRNSTGTVFNTLTTYSNLNAAADYTQTSFDLTSYKGQTIQIYLVATENSSLKTSFVVDDFALNVKTP